ncbi:MAG: hypothetical protein KAR37_10105 [Alphaproteobacteria bacterium]|nr:hypothetical protein [Alphaproteobacteria bacterium]
MFPGPISEPDATEIDRRLVGSWYAMVKPKSESGEPSDPWIWYLNIGLSKDKLLNGVMILTPAQPESLDMNDTVTMYAAKAWPSVVDGKAFYNIFLRSGFERGRFMGWCPVADEGCHSVARVSFSDDDAFVLRFVGGETVRALIKDGLVPAKKLGNRGDNYVLDITGAEIVSLLRDYPGDELFQFPDEPLVFHRLKSPATGQ